MEIIIDSAEVQLNDIAFSVEKDPLSWEKWSCLHIKTPKISSPDENYHVIVSASTVIEIYMEETEGKTFFCESGDIFIICRHFPESILNDIGQHIIDIYQAKTAADITMKIYDLCNEGMAFIESYLEKNEEFMEEFLGKSEIAHHLSFSMPLSDGKEVWEHSRKVLLVDDDAIICRIVNNVLQDECKIVTVQKANKAIQSYKQSHPNVVFLDIGLADGDGSKLLEEIVTLDPSAYVVMFSSHDDMGTMVDAFKHGAKGFLAKPFTKEKLIHYINDCNQYHQAA